MDKSISILLVGIGGYGNLYVNSLLDNKREDLKIVGIIDPYPESCRRLAELKELNIPFFSSLAGFYAENQADLVVISSPIQFHAEQSCYALEHGSNVLCEKPISATIQQAERMKKTSEETGNFLDIGYQWSHAKAIQLLKKDINNGVFGKPIRLKTLVLWPRDARYFKRGWAAKISDQQGNWILDSVANNATAHYLHNMFYVLGDQTNKSALPANAQGELYRANQIDNFDTAAFRVYTKDDVELLYLVSHAINEKIDPSFYYQFEKAEVIFGDMEDTGGKIIAKFNDGKIKDYGDPFLDVPRKLWLAIEAVRQEKKEILCGPEAAMSHTITINGIQEETAITDFPADLVGVDQNNITFVKGLSDILIKCYQNWSLPGEANVSWAQTGEQVDLSNYHQFKGVKGL